MKYRVGAGLTETLTQAGHTRLRNMALMMTMINGFIFDQKIQHKRFVSSKSRPIKTDIEVKV